jgi:hypothetical protein
MSYYVHNIPGRLRVRSAKIKRDTCQAANLCTQLAAMEGIHNTELNKKAGSLIVYYDPKCLSADDILYMGHKLGCLDQAISTTKRPSALATTAGAMLGNAIFGTVVKKSLESSMFSLVKAAVR